MRPPEQGPLRRPTEEVVIMDKRIWGMLNSTEQALLRDAEPKALDDLDEDELCELHDRIRRARNKYSKLYRRRAAAEVKSAGARAKGHARHARTAAKAEAFEDALARVSRHLARAAKASAAELRAERLAAAGRAKSAKPKRGSKAGTKAGKGKKAGAAEGKAPGKGRQPRATKTPMSKKANASTRARNKRTQVRGDRR